MNKILALISTVVVIAAAFVAYRRIDVPAEETIDLGLPESTATRVEDSGETARIKVDAGDSASGIGERLENEGVINSARLFRALVSLMGLEDNLGAGDYEFGLDTPILLVIDALRRGGATDERSVAIPEGLRLEEIAAILEENEITTADEFLDAAGSPSEYEFEFLADLPKKATLEGYLFPATYEFKKGTNAVTVVERMLEAFDENVSAQTIAAAKRLGLNIHELVTLASIVEREAVVTRERPIIARVYLNRIANDMRLQADPTTQYAVATKDPESAARNGWWKRELTVDDLALASPYNTYASDGLPPGPIAAPGAASLEAVAEPTDDDFLFFVACGEDGEHEFAATLADHEANVARCQG